MWDLPEPISGKRGRPKKYGDKLPLDSINDFHDEGKFGKYKAILAAMGWNQGYAA